MIEQFLLFSSYASFFDYSFFLFNDISSKMRGLYILTCECSSFHEFDYWGKRSNQKNLSSNRRDGSSQLLLPLSFIFHFHNSLLLALYFFACEECCVFINFYLLLCCILSRNRAIKRMLGRRFAYCEGTPRHVLQKLLQMKQKDRHKKRNPMNQVICIFDLLNQKRICVRDSSWYRSCVAQISYPSSVFLS